MFDDRGNRIQERQLVDMQLMLPQNSVCGTQNRLTSVLGQLCV